MRLTARTDAHGDFTLALPAGAYDILVVSQAFAARAETVASTLGKTKVVRWKLDFVGCDYPGMNCDPVSVKSK